MDTSKLANRLKKLQEKSSGGKNIWFKSSDEKKKIRLVPYPHTSDASPFIEVYFHYNVAGNRSIICPKETIGEPCPICELAEEFRNMGTKDAWKTYKSLAPKLRTYSPILVRGEEDKGVLLWGYGVTIYEALIEKFMDPDWGDLSDVKTGRDLTVWTVAKGSAGNDSEFDKPKMDVSPNQTPLLAKKSDIVKILEDMPDYMNDGATFPIRSYQELQDVVRKLSNVEDEEEESSYAAPTEESDDDESTADEATDDDDFRKKLKNLLEK